MKQTGPSYEAYEKAYAKQSKSMEKRGLSMYAEKLSELQYKTLYKALRNELKAEVESGKRKVISNVNQYIVRKQAYKTSKKQAENLKVVAEKMGFKISELQIREGGEKAKEFSKALKKSKSEYEARGEGDLFNQEIFGSK